MRRSEWRHKKYPNRTYRGIYKRDSNGERIFELKCNEKSHRITLESWQMAKSIGWFKYY